MGDKKDGFVIGDGAHRVHGGAAVCLIQPLERLIEHKQVRLRAESARERAPPPHPAGELRGGNGETLAKAKPRQYIARLALLFPSGGEQNVFERRELRAEPILLKYRGAAPPSGVSRPRMSRSSVVFPPPETPVMTVVSPSGRLAEKLRKTTVSP